ncbi:dTDP-4-dehydrorhamnose 3,5-epimerase family protein [Microbispora sp. NPDC049125]|uniref:dTDP-4-dehydrorhamnose 3,5-epimerase family protein n=1 Tax=Microbispora sp. NPDC049125 TaxID=3154929 RepID=UPI003467C155
MGSLQELPISDAYVFTPTLHGDERGAFLEWYKADLFAREIGHPLNLAQANCSISRRGVLRGVHYADVPVGQAKYVTCLTGSALDVIVDLRVGSPTFGRWEVVELDETTRKGVYLAEGLGHAFLATSDQVTCVYLCSEPYRPAKEHGVDPLDPELGIAWPEGVEPVLSPKDAEAPSLAEALSLGLLPDYGECLAYYAKLRSS